MVEKKPYRWRLRRDVYPTYSKSETFDLISYHCYTYFEVGDIIELVEFDELKRKDTGNTFIGKISEIKPIAKNKKMGYSKNVISIKPLKIMEEKSNV